ncbi:FAD/NAD(P)-binding protein [Tunicatimonas pelagia]|uniref:FAD/NAD(P)-binding protein n=1 Tax=Tunicatimonas pelagia TaxID=931531 RepID=UPI0026657A37|nr:FAD/NAD(P)-binding protein [Tunicatimonas pelagia]WKN42184.1 FAD/NAD(P)-binding protein [Tunicatimonas pelagia]
MKHIAIVGVGPRGLSALENFFTLFSENPSLSKVHFTLFENARLPGSGSIWDTEQPTTNWLNISERALKNLPGRPSLTMGSIQIPSFPSYTEWLPESEQSPPEKAPDRFPPRSKMGNYLQKRYSSIANILIANNLVTLVTTSVKDINVREQQIILEDYNSESYVFDEVLLTIGHQPTELSDQIRKWKEYEENNPNVLLFEKSYPAEDISNTKHVDQNSVVGIRGFGLAMIDTVRALTIGRGGKFTIENDKTLESAFVSGENVPKKIVAFSLDGNPMAPKPLNAQIDERYTPTANEIREFAQKIEKAASDREGTTSDMFLKEAIGTIATRVYCNLDDNSNTAIASAEVFQAVVNWLTDESIDHPLIQSVNNSAYENMQAFTQMALGKEAVSLDYCIGQVWRHCQPTLYEKFAHANLSGEVIASVVSLDERIKRYSYGPPLESTQQLLALLKADILTLDFIQDPEINMKNNGWELSSNGNEITVDTMINSVLDPPRLLDVTSPIILNLLSNSLVEPVHSELGIHTKRNACIEWSEGKNEIPLAVLGRLSKGSVLGVDAILECFSPNERAWAQGAVERLIAEEKLITSQ